MGTVLLKTEERRGVILQIGSIKGGVSKSTLVENLAVEFNRLGYKVCIVDSDFAQQTLSKWADRRNSSIDEGVGYAYLPCFLKQGKIKKDLVELSGLYDFVLVETIGSGQELRSALLCSDIIYVPTQVSQNSLESLEEFEGILEESEELNADRRVVVVVVQAPTTPSSRQKVQAREFISQFADKFELSRCTTYQRTAYAIAPRSGGSVVEDGDAKAKAEIQVLAQEILSYA